MISTVLQYNTNKVTGLDRVKGFFHRPGNCLNITYLHSNIDDFLLAPPRKKAAPQKKEKKFLLFLKSPCNNILQCS